jgi:hypothetical protein
MLAPAIVGFRLVWPLPAAGTDGTLAVLTVEHGPWLVSGLRLAVKSTGHLYLKPPYVKNEGDRITIRSSPEREALLAEAKALLRGFLEARAAAPPLATAPETSEPSE